MRLPLNATTVVLDLPEGLREALTVLGEQERKIVRRPGHRR